ncbi:uncharacterized protein LOC129799802 [Phlebotomus papatasi]|uniref:uncharacterized protein LOC129799802 n=1 Tax=Phlebotomus papatasi TaxID=29031 RepID=UPI0024845553|nr:uncharacterized protein LOC129799802 [Phlebotomus papatasi]
MISSPMCTEKQLSNATIDLRSEILFAQLQNSDTILQSNSINPSILEEILAEPHSIDDQRDNPDMDVDLERMENNQQNFQIGQGIDSEINSGPQKTVEILGKEKTFNRRFKVTQMSVHFRLKRPENATHGFDWMSDAFQEIIEAIASEGDNGDKAALEFHLPKKPEIVPIYVGLTPIKALTPDMLLDRIEKVNQSNASFGVSDDLLIEANIVHMMQGSGRNKASNMSLSEMRRYKKYSIIDTGSQELCLPIALLFGRVINMKNREKRNKTLKSWTRYHKLLKEYAVNLIKQCNVRESPKGEYDLSLISNFEKVFPKYFVKVFDNVHDWKSVAYESQHTSQNSVFRINIFFDKKSNHYFLIRNIF